MNSAEEVAIPYNRRTLFQVFILALVLLLVELAGVVALAYAALFDAAFRGIRERCMSFIDLAALCFILCFGSIWALFLGRCLRFRTPAFLFHQDGIVDNATGHWVGLIYWSEIERIYAADLRFRVPFAPRVRLRIPRRRLVFIVLKQGTELLSRQPQWKRSLLRIEPERGILRVDERMLTVTATEFMQSLNEYYVTHVRREGLP